MNEWKPVNERMEKIIDALEQAKKAIDLLIEQEMKKVDNVKETLEVLKKRKEDGQGKQ